MKSPRSEPGSTPPPLTGIQARGSSGPLNWLLNLFSNVWLGVTFMVLLFFYCSVGSAVPRFRQQPWLEMTEFEWFHWWPFSTLIVLTCLALATVTLRRIPFRAVNAGVWMIHTGIITLCLGSWYYFGTKIEGDAPVFRRQVLIRMPGLLEPESLVVVPGAQMSVERNSEHWHFAIQSTNTEWPILSEPHVGEKAYAVNVMVTPPAPAEPFVRLLLDGYPQYTEDVIPGKGRAVKSTGKKLVNEDLELTLEYEPQEYFHLINTWALFTRRLGKTEWHERPIRGMPRYNDYLASRDQVDFDHDLRLRSLDLEVPAADLDDPLGLIPVRVTGYLRYAQMRRLLRDGGPRLNPVLRLKLQSPTGPAQDVEMVAFDPARNNIQGIMEFVWANNRAELQQLRGPLQSHLTIEVPEQDISFEVEFGPDTIVGPEGAFTEIEGTDFAYRITGVQDDLEVGANSVSVALMDIKTPEGEFKRWVMDRAELSRDIHGDPQAPHQDNPNSIKPLDPRIKTTYQPSRSSFIFAALPTGEVYCVVNSAADEEAIKPVHPNAPTVIAPNLVVSSFSLIKNAHTIEKPFVVAPNRRDRDMGERMAMIRLEVGSGSRTQSYWIGFQPYALPDRSYAASGRFMHRPQLVRMTNGETVEVIFSRERRRLPAPIALDNFELLTHVGGYTGSGQSIFNFESSLRFLTDGQWSEPASIQVNDPTQFGGLWYFQSFWDPPSAGAGSGHNHTGLGIANRHGVYIQLLGCCLAVIGMMYAFYVKPILKRRRKELAWAKVERSEPGEPALPREREAPIHVGVVD